MEKNITNISLVKAQKKKKLKKKKRKNLFKKKNLINLKELVITSKKNRWKQLDGRWTKFDLSIWIKSRLDKIKKKEKKRMN